MSKKRNQSKLIDLLDFFLDYPDFTLCVALILSVIIISAATVIAVMIAT